METNHTLPDWVQLDDAGDPIPVVPEGADPLDDLTVAELGHVGKLLKYDPYAAVKQDDTGLRWPALAHLVWTWAKRQHGPHVKLDPILQLKPAQISQLAGLNRPDPLITGEEVDDVERNPTDPAHAS